MSLSSLECCLVGPVLVSSDCLRPVKENLPASNKYLGRGKSIAEKSLVVMIHVLFGSIVYKSICFFLCLRYCYRQAMSYYIINKIGINDNTPVFPAMTVWLSDAQLQIKTKTRFCHVIKCLR